MTRSSRWIIGSWPASKSRLRAIVGPVAIKGLDDKSAINLDTLSDGDEDFGLLDGMVYGGLDAKTRVIVTTDGLFRRWLRTTQELDGQRTAAGCGRGDHGSGLL